MTQLQFFRKLLRIGAEPHQALRLEHQLAPLAEHKIERESIRIRTAEDLNRVFAERRKQLWDEISREMKKGASAESVLKILLGKDF